MTEIYKNIMLYWADENPSDSVVNVLNEWRRLSPTWNVSLYSRQTASAYLNRHFGHETEALFRSCAIPAMQSDVFRVFWALLEGGIYCDFTFAPKAEPNFFSLEKPLTLTRWWHGRIINGVFYAAKDCKELKLLADEIMTTLRLKEEKSIWRATGPGLWIRVLGQQETETISIVTREELIDSCLRYSDYQSTRGTDDHWSVRENYIDIFSG